MDLIIGAHGSGRTLRCFNYARENNAIIVSDNARALRVKAKALGFNDIEIVLPRELNGDYDDHDRKVLLYKWDNVIKEQWKHTDGVNVVAMSFDEECNINQGETE